MEIPTTLARELDLEAALDRTVPARGEFFPSRVEAFAARHASEAVVRALRSDLRTARSLGPADIVFVPRRTVGTRPAYDTGFRDRTILAALVLLLGAKLAPIEEQFGLTFGLEPPPEGTHRNFEQLPLEDDDASAIVITDVAAFYEYVDHALLENEIVELTGDLDLATAITGGLADLVGRSFGLPQGPRASDAVGTLYLGQIDRALTRRGITAFRYGDEFRLPVSSNESPSRLLTALEEELRRVGLVINAAKTRVVSRGNYEDALRQLADRMEAAQETTETEFEFYGFDPDEFEGAEWGDLPPTQLEEAFVEAVESTDEGDNVSERLLLQFLPLLAAAESPVAVAYLPTLVRGHAWLARSISLYLRSLAGTEHEEEMVAAVGTLLRSRTYMFPWVRGWLIDPLAYATEPLPEATRRHLRTCINAARLPWFTRARAAIALATQKELPPQADFSALFEDAAPSARPDFVAAVCIEEPSWQRRFVNGIRGDPLLREIPTLIESSEHYTHVI